MSFVFLHLPVSGIVCFTRTTLFTTMYYCGVFIEMYIGVYQVSS